MENIFIFAGLVTFLYFVLKVIEMKYVDQELKPLKHIIRDISMVFVSSLVAAFVSSRYQTSINDFFHVMTKTKVMSNDQTQVFTGEPGF